jgi:hypothetical protein
LKATYPLLHVKRLSITNMTILCQVKEIICFL